MSATAAADLCSQMGTSSGASRDLSSPIAPEDGPDHPGLLLRRRRLHLGMSQREVGIRAGLPQSHVCAVEAGKPALFSTYERLFEATGARLAVAVRPFRVDEDIFAEMSAERVAAEEELSRRRQSRPKRPRRALPAL